MAFLLASSAAQALPSISIIWRGVGATLVSPAGTSNHIADIVLTSDVVTIGGVFISIEFDAAELQAVNATELAVVNLPGMGNEFAPVSVGTVIDNGAGLIIEFDEATLSTGLVGGVTRTLGSVTFHVVAGANDNTDIDVIASLQNPGIDAITIAGGGTTNGTFVGASVTGPVVPEPTTALLVIAGLAGLGYAGRRGLR
ncbi:MAG: PEP-CTERM sorting domain-containing protein [Myxococcota bacterium]|nr:PEP-CTERM sorting domain-containing protein [Myxococcota bacterium]